MVKQLKRKKTRIENNSIINFIIMSFSILLISSSLYSQTNLTCEGTHQDGANNDQYFKIEYSDKLTFKSLMINGVPTVVIDSTYEKFTRNYISKKDNTFGVITETEFIIGKVDYYNMILTITDNSYWYNNERDFLPTYYYNCTHN